MPEGGGSGKTPALFFRDQLIAAMEHQRVSTSAFTESYLVNLLSAFAKGETLPSREPGFDETPLALLYARVPAAAAGGAPRARVGGRAVRARRPAAPARRRRALRLRLLRREPARWAR